MNNLAKAIIVILVLFFLLGRSYAQELSIDSRNVKAAWEELQKDTLSQQKQLAYLNAFPGKKQTFMKIFQPDDFKELSDGHDYIFGFFALSKHYPHTIIDKAISIGKDLIWDADATNYMQHGIVELGNAEPRLFADKLKSLPSSQRAHLIAFLADKENHRAYPEYQHLIASLNKIGEIKLSKQFSEAKALRIKQKNH